MPSHLEAESATPLGAVVKVVKGCEALTLVIRSLSCYGGLIRAIGDADRSDGSTWSRGSRKAVAVCCRLMQSA
jgi:hypothetical protein